MPLEQDQKDFIKSKVEKLGSIQAVEEFYNQDCLVDKWANVYTSTIFDKPEKFSRKKEINAK